MSASAQFQTVGSRIIVARDTSESVTKGGILIPDSSKEKPLQGRVLVVGTGRLDARGNLLPMQVKVGDRVLFGKYAGQNNELVIDGFDCVIMDESEVLAIKRDPPAES